MLFVMIGMGYLCARPINTYDAEWIFPNFISRFSFHLTLNYRLIFGRDIFRDFLFVFFWRFKMYALFPGVIKTYHVYFAWQPKLFGKIKVMKDCMGFVSISLLA